MIKQRGFSLYDVEAFLKDAGAEMINENAVTSLEKEMEDTIKELVSEASVYANYAGRSKLIRASDMDFIADKNKFNGGKTVIYANILRRKANRKRRTEMHGVRRHALSSI